MEEKKQEKINEKADERIKKSKDRSGLPRSERSIRRLALTCVVEMMQDEKSKPSDRLNAAKMLMDYFIKPLDGANEEEIRIVFENLPDGYAE